MNGDVMRLGRRRGGGSLPGTFLGLLLCSSLGLAEQAGSLRGQAVDPGLLALEKAAIRVMPRTTRSTKYRSQASRDGTFHVDGIEPGTYIVAVSFQGFREKFIDNVVVTAGSEVDLGRVLLALSGCDAPGVICDDITGRPPPDTTFSRGEIRVPLECRADIDRGKVLCGDRPDRLSDFRLHVRLDKHLYLEPRNGARLAEPNAANADCRSGIFLDGPIGIDALGIGSDFCVRSSKGRISRIFVTGEVEPDSQQIDLYYVTEK